MNLQELEDAIGKHQPHNGCGNLWSNRDKKWIATCDLVGEQHFIVMNSPGGDSFVYYAKDFDELAEMAQKAVDGHYSDCGDEQIKLICQNGHKKKIRIKLD
jgi:hypothetical protein